MNKLHDTNIQKLLKCLASKKKIIKFFTFIVYIIGCLAIGNPLHNNKSI